MASFLVWPKVCSIESTVCIRHDLLISPFPSPPRPHPYLSSIIFPSNQWEYERLCVYYTVLGLQLGQTKNDDRFFCSKWCLVYVCSVLFKRTLQQIRGKHALHRLSSEREAGDLSVSVFGRRRSTPTAAWSRRICTDCWNSTRHPPPNNMLASYFLKPFWSYYLSFFWGGGGSCRLNYERIFNPRCSIS
jgi:hypothetical protein